MKRFLFSLIFGVCISIIYAQENVTLFFLNDGSFKGFYDEEIDSISYSHFDLDSAWHHNVVVQDIWLTDSVVRIPIESIDSICHKVPEPIYKPGIIKLDERYLPFIQSVEGLSITFSSALPQSLRPHIGDVLLYEESSDLFPEGFAGKVTNEGNSVMCEEVEMQDIYEKFVLFGNYVVVEEKSEGSNSPAYSLRRMNSRNLVEAGEDAGGGGGGGSWLDNIWDYGIESWRLGYSNKTHEKKLNQSIKLDYKKIHTSVNIDLKATYVISVEFAWDLYSQSKTWGIYYKRTVKTYYDNKFYVKYSRDTKPEDESEKNFKNNFWKGHEPEWIEPKTKEGDEKDDDKTQTINILNVDIPIPECPLFKLGVKFGFFFQPKLEGEFKGGYESKGSTEKTYIYKLDRENLFRKGDSWEYDGPEESEDNIIAEGSVKGSIWCGIVAGVRLKFNIGKLAGCTEEANFRFGPYAELELKADFAEAVKNRSMYSLIKDSKCRIGFKLGLDVKFTAKIAGGILDFEHKQMDWSPKELIGECNLYFFPEFDAPKYSINGNSLRCWTNVSRVTLPNKIGYILLKEDGTEAGRKYLDASYSFLNPDVQFADSENPFQMVLTFDNLDFVNHRYTIVPTTRLFGWQLFGFDMPDKLQTVVLCPNSNHPHLIDMGLPSGTKWLCCNVYADAPEDDGGYYQWGKPYKTHIYNDATYRAPVITTADYQGTSYDAATANLGEAYSTPTLKQFRELLDNCTSSPRYSTWGNITGTTKGLYLKGKNGGNLYLPFSGFMKDTKIYNESKNEGFYLASDALDSENKPIRKAFDVTENLVVADAKAHGYSVRPVSAGKVGLVSFSHQEVVWDGVYVGQESGQTVVVTNDGNSPAKITVTQTNAPFTVDAKCVGTFTIKPKERKDVLVLFKPTELENFESLLNIQYEIDNACTVCKIPLKGKGISQYEPTTETFTVNGFSFKMIGVEGGTFQMGSENGDEDEKPIHDVTLSSYSIGETEVTQALWTAVMGSNPSYFKGDNLPVETVSWDDCQTFITKLNQLTGKQFRLPTEAEWEFAAKGGTQSRGYTYSGSDSIDNVAWYRANAYDKGPSSYGTQIVATKSPNELGIYDMTGNVREWCQDWYGDYSSSAQTNPTGPASGSGRVNRGGHWFASPPYCRSAKRYSSTGIGNGLGLRLVLSDTNPSPEPDDHEYVDLGLPSGTLWATCNVGANNPWESGDYFAWGETEPKDTYYWDTYVYYGGFDDENGLWLMKKYCTNTNYGYNHIKDNKTELDSYDDAATVNWGIDWQMPSADQIEELCNSNYTQTEWDDFHDGLNVVSKINGNSIFLPFASYYAGTSLDQRNLYEWNFYWSRSLHTRYPHYAQALRIKYDSIYLDGSGRYYGCPVRPVRSGGSSSGGGDASGHQEGKTDTGDGVDGGDSIGGSSNQGGGMIDE